MVTQLLDDLEADGTLELVYRARFLITHWADADELRDHGALTDEEVMLSLPPPASRGQALLRIVGRHAIGNLFRASHAEARDYVRDGAAEQATALGRDELVRLHQSWLRHRDLLAPPWYRQLLPKIHERISSIRAHRIASAYRAWTGSPVRIPDGLPGLREADLRCGCGGNFKIVHEDGLVLLSRHHGGDRFMYPLPAAAWSRSAAPPADADADDERVPSRR